MQELLSLAGPAFEGALDPSTGVYIGCMYTEYLDGVLHKQGVADTNSAAIIGHGLSFLVGRLSYTFGFQVHSAKLEPTMLIRQYFLIDLLHCVVLCPDTKFERMTRQKLSI